MSQLRRYFTKGNTYFITNVTFNRMRILVEHIDLLHQAIAKQQEAVPFDLIAWMVLPDHFHAVIDPINHDLSDLLQRIKLSFSTTFRKRAGWKSGRVWQLRFWDHVIRDQEDMNAHLNYIHYNPVKHGFAKSPFVYPHSSAQQFLKEGFYLPNWGAQDDVVMDGDFGE